MTTITPQELSRVHLLKTLGGVGELHCNEDKRGIVYSPKKGEIVTVYDEGHPRGFRLEKM